MAILRIHGKLARFFVQIGGAGTLYQLGTISSMDIPRTADRADATAFGDSNKVSTKGFDDGDITFEGWYDANDTVLAAAKASATSSNFFAYPNYAADKTRFYMVPGDMDYGYRAEIGGTQRITNGHVYATDSATDNL